MSRASPSDAVATMQGTLWKWTNYLSGEFRREIVSVKMVKWWCEIESKLYCLMILDTGWQPRWFVLEGGSLSYFLSPNEVHLGSRGSLKVSSCDILGQSLAEMTFLQCIFLHDDISFSMVMEAMMNEFF